jgi:DNA polymerase III subunit beta
LKVEGTKATIPLAGLNHTLKVVERAIARNTTIPILSCVRMEQLAAGLALEATDLDLAIRAVMKDENGGPEAPLVMPAEHFIKWTKLLSGDKVKISATDKRATLTSGRARAVLPVFNASQWPNANIDSTAGDRLEFGQEALKRALSFAAISMSTEDLRYVLNGILLQGDGMKLKVVSTDGHCMMVYTMTAPAKIKLLLPAKLIKGMLPLLDDNASTLDLAFDEKRIQAIINEEKTSIFLSSTKIAGMFPAWEKALPSDKRVSVAADGSELMESLERCLLLSDENSRCVRLTFAEQITIEASSALNGEARETVECEGHPEEPVTTGICGEFLLNLLKKLDGKIHIDLPPDKMSPLLFWAQPHDDEVLSYLIMPMRF